MAGATAMCHTTGSPCFMYLACFSMGQGARGDPE